MPDVIMRSNYPAILILSLKDTTWEVTWWCVYKDQLENVLSGLGVRYIDLLEQILVLSPIEPCVFYC